MARKKVRITNTIRRLRFALELKPDHGQATAQLGSLLLSKGQVEEAIDVLASDTGHGWAGGVVAKALSYLVAGDRDEARNLLERTLSRDSLSHNASDTVHSRRDDTEQKA